MKCTKYIWFNEQFSHSQLFLSLKSLSPLFSQFKYFSLLWDHLKLEFEIIYRVHIATSCPHSLCAQGKLYAIKQVCSSVHVFHFSFHFTLVPNMHTQLVLRIYRSCLVIYNKGKGLITCFLVYAYQTFYKTLNTTILYYDILNRC